jgi:hypothetical protein
MIRKGHPALKDGELSIEAFANLPHALFTIRRDTIPLKNNLQQ